MAAVPIPIQSYNLVDVFAKSWQIDFDIRRDRQLYLDNIHNGHIIDYKLVNEILVWYFTDNGNFNNLFRYERVAEILPLLNNPPPNLDIRNDDNDRNKFITVQVIKILIFWAIIYYNYFDHSLNFLNQYTIQTLQLYKGMSIQSKKWLNFCKYYGWIDANNQLDITRIQTKIGNVIELIAFSSATMLADVTDQFMAGGNPLQNILFIIEIPRDAFRDFTHLYYGGSFDYTPTTTRTDVRATGTYLVHHFLDDQFEEFEFLINIGAYFRIKKAETRARYTEITLEFIHYYNQNVLDTLIVQSDSRGYIQGLVSSILNKEPIAESLGFDEDNFIQLLSRFVNIRHAGIVNGGKNKKTKKKKGGETALVLPPPPQTPLFNISTSKDVLNTQELPPQINQLDSNFRNIINELKRERPDDTHENNVNLNQYLRENLQSFTAPKILKYVDENLKTLAKEILEKNKTLNLNNYAELHEFNFYVYLFKSVISAEGDNYETYFGSEGGKKLKPKKKLLKKYKK